MTSPYHEINWKDYCVKGTMNHKNNTPAFDEEVEDHQLSMDKHDHRMFKKEVTTIYRIRVPKLQMFITTIQLTQHPIITIISLYIPLNYYSVK